MDHDTDALHAAIDEILAGHREAFRHIVREYGLGVRGLHEQGITGRGVSIGIVDRDDLSEDVERQISIGLERADLIRVNGPIFTNTGKAIHLRIKPQSIRIVL